MFVTFNEAWIAFIIKPKSNKGKKLNTVATFIFKYGWEGGGGEEI